MKKENQSHIEEIVVQKQEVKHFCYQLQQIYDITMVSQVTNYCSGIFITLIFNFQQMYDSSGGIQTPVDVIATLQQVRV